MGSGALRCPRSLFLTVAAQERVKLLKANLKKSDEELKELAAVTGHCRLAHPARGCVGARFRLQRRCGCKRAVQGRAALVCRAALRRCCCRPPSENNIEAEVGPPPPPPPPSPSPPPPPSPSTPASCLVFFNLIVPLRLQPPRALGKSSSLCVCKAFLPVAAALTHSNFQAALRLNHCAAPRPHEHTTLPLHMINYQ